MTTFRFRGGHVALDLAATLAARLRDEPRELLTEPRDLARWLVEAGLVETELRVTPAELEEARALREVIYRLAVARSRRRALDDADRRLVNRYAAHATPAPRLEADGTIGRSRPDALALLALIAREAIDLLGGPLRDRVRRCSGDGCAILFVDASRSGKRKWCSMTACGNKTKVAMFRERNRES